MSQKIKLAMQRFNCYVQLSRAKACFSRGKDSLVPKWPGVESATLFQEFAESKIGTKFADKRKAASTHCECQGIRHIAKK
jgi:hypothetical protein